MALLEAIKPFKYMGRDLRPGDPVEPDPENAGLVRQLLDQRRARHTTTPTAGESSGPTGTGRGRRRTPRPTAPAAGDA